MTRRLVRYNDLREFGIPWSRMHLNRLERRGLFPRRVHLGEMTIAWFADEITAFVAAKAEARTDPTKPAIQSSAEQWRRSRERGSCNRLVAAE